jgi:Transposase
MPPWSWTTSTLTRTVRAWEAEILAFHITGGCSNGSTEAVNLLIKKVKRVGHGFRNFTNYRLRLRLLLHCGVAWRPTGPQACEPAHSVGDVAVNCLAAGPRAVCWALGCRAATA